MIYRCIVGIWSALLLQHACLLLMHVLKITFTLELHSGDASKPLDHDNVRVGVKRVQT